VKIEVAEARPVGVFFFISLESSVLTRGLVLELFVLIVLWFTSLLYSIRVGNRVVILSASVVLGIGIIIDTPCLARDSVALEGSVNLLISL
jgi:hypothetical protein